MANKEAVETGKQEIGQESLRAFYARRRREFSAADLQKYTEEIGQTFPFRPLLASLEIIHQKETGKRKKA